MSHYDTLGVSNDASPEEIKKAYRKKARQLHPDVNPSEDAAEEFKRVTLAYEVLSDPEKRRNYDTTGDEQGRAGYPGGDGYPGGGFSGFGGFEDLLNMFTGGAAGARGPASRMRQGQDDLITVSISLQDAVFGVEKTIERRSANNRHDATAAVDFGRQNGTIFRHTLKDTGFNPEIHSELCSCSFGNICPVA